jgi:hypothetical protein
MAKPSTPADVYLEIGKKRTLAGAIDWPGWCRGGRDEQEALQTLVDYGPRYESVLRAAGLDFHAPPDVSGLKVVDRLEGNATTDFGAPNVPPSGDAAPLENAELRRLEAILEACWAALDAAAQAAHGKELSKGPRGGGRDLEEIVRHVMDAEASYLNRLGGSLPKEIREDDRSEALKQRQRVILDTLAAASRGELPPQGPRGGARWPPRYFVRRAAWHVLDHVWEIEDRVI